MEEFNPNFDEDEEEMVTETIPTNLNDPASSPDSGNGDIMAQAPPTSNKMPLAVQFVMAIILLFQIVLEEPKPEKGYTFCIVSSIVSVLAIVFAAVLIVFKPDLKETVLFDVKVIGAVSVGYLTDMFLFFWWCITSGIVTFDGPFVEAGNGYFASWGGFIFSIMGLGVSAETMKSSVKGLGSLLGLGVCSIVILCATTPEFGTMYQTEATYAFFVALGTVVFVGAILYTKREETLLAFYVLGLLSCLWIVLAFWTTFRGPFLELGNGYFGAWGGAVLSLMAAFEIRQVDRLPVFVQNAIQYSSSS